MAEPPQKKLKGSSILKESPLVMMNRRLLPAILSPLTYRLRPTNLMRTFSLKVSHFLLPTR